MIYILLLTIGLVLSVERNFNQITKCMPSNNVNAWKMRVADEIFIVTPAHVAFYEKDNKWTMSQFLDDFKELDWKVPASYIIHQDVESDLCWAKWNHNNLNDGTNYLSLAENIVLPLSVDVVFRQPFDMHGNKVNSIDSTIGVVEKIVYRTPYTYSKVDDCQIESVNCDMFEAIDTGFRGMSGAVAISNGFCVGMFVKRGTQVKFRKNKIDSMKKKHKFDAIASFIRRYLGLYDVDEVIDKITADVLTQTDLHELGVVFDARRGIFLPSTRIASLVSDKHSISLKQIIGKGCFIKKLF